MEEDGVGHADTPTPTVRVRHWGHTAFPPTCPALVQPVEQKYFLLIAWPPLFTLYKPNAALMAELLNSLYAFPQVPHGTRCGYYLYFPDCGAERYSD